MLGRLLVSFWVILNTDLSRGRPFPEVTRFPRPAVSRGRPFPEVGHFPRSAVSRGRPFPEAGSFPRSAVSRGRPFPEVGHFPRSAVSRGRPFPEVGPFRYPTLHALSHHLPHVSPVLSCSVTSTNKVILLTCRTQSMARPPPNTTCNLRSLYNTKLHQTWKYEKQASSSNSMFISLKINTQQRD